jgi:nucleoid-associated protein YgaU
MRIDALGDAIAAGKAGLVIVSLAEALDGVDIAFLQDRARSAPFWNAALRDLSSRMAVYARLQSIVFGRKVQDPGDETYTVVAGDTLTTIAERLLGSRSYVDDILRLNPQVTDPDRIEIGDRLKLPALAART